jgi:hypothetical protein
VDIFSALGSQNVHDAKPSQHHFTPVKWTLVAAFSNLGGLDHIERLRRWVATSDEA